MTKTELKIQEVTGLIRRSSVIKSHRWATKTNMAGRSERSAGIYAEKAWDGSINVRYNLNNYAEHNMRVADEEMAEFLRFAKCQGYIMIQEARWTYRIEAN